MKLWERLIHEEDGATATEYAIIVAILGVALVGAFFTFKDKIINAMDSFNIEEQDPQ